MKDTEVLKVSKDKLLRLVYQQKEIELKKARLLGILFSRDDRDIRNLDSLENSYYILKGQFQLLMDAGVFDHDEYDQYMSYLIDDLREWFIDGILKDMFGISRKESADND